MYSTYSPSQVSGTYNLDLGTLCWGEIDVVATSCNQTGDPRFTDTAHLASPHTRPWVTVELMKSNDPAKGRYQADIDYGLGQDVAGRGVRVTRMRWIGANGQEHAAVTFPAFATSGPLTGRETLYFTPPDGAKQVRIDVEARGCGIATANDSIDCECDQRSVDPVYFSSGNMQLTDTDPLPPVGGHALTRTYDSDEEVSGLFGRGFTTILDQRLMRDAIGARQIASIVTSVNDVVTFEGIGGVWRQTWPTAQRNTGTLSYDALAAAYTYRGGGSMQELVFRSSDGKLTVIRDRATGREGRIAYTGSAATTFTDSWTDVKWTFTIASGRVTSISVNTAPALTWTYTYDAAGNLTTVLAPGNATWRTYEYPSGRMTASRDASGNLIESHAYDANGYAIDSTGPGDEIASIAYNLAGNAAARERVTRVTMKSGATTDYILRPVGGALRVVQVIGACASCGGGAGDKTLVRDVRGRVIREQGSDGFISVTTFDGNHLLSQEGPFQPEGCDPATAADQCRMDTDELEAAILEPTAATTSAAYTYGDAAWPEKATAVVTPSVAAPAQTRSETFLYHALSGAVLLHETTGYTGKTGEEAVQTRERATTLYEQPGGVTPAFTPGGSFATAWLTLPQPTRRVKSVDGPREDAADVTSFVYYPIHSTVPALLRGHLAATRNAAGHITRYETYDAFGNVTRAVDPNGVATEMTYDVLGRLATSKIKGVAGCNATKDPLCGVDLIGTSTYQPAAGPLHIEQRPGGGVTVYTYDARGRVKTVSRGPSASDLREQIETTYDALTGRKTAERTRAYEGGTWVEKTSQSYTYTSEGELETVVHADQTSVAYTYDAAGRMAAVRDENHASPNTEYAYDAAGRMKTVKQKLASGWTTTSYAYDLHGNLASVTDPNGNVTAYAYDDFGQMIRQESPVTGTTRYDYDEAGNLVTSADANGMSTERTYDALGRVISTTSAVVASPDPPPPAPTRPETVTWSYDDPTAGRYGIGRLTSMIDPAGTTLYEYERRGLLAQEQRTFDGCFTTTASGTNCGPSFENGPFVTGYRYDADGNRSAIHYPSNELSVTYTFDHAGRPLSASGAVTAAQYLPFGPLAQLTFANGTVQTLSYDTRYRVLANKLSSPAGLLAHFDYQYDAVGNITGIADVLDAGYSRSFGYDDLNRLVTANSGPALWKLGSYTWDAMGNPLTMKLGEVAPGGDDGLLRTGPRIGIESQWVPGGRTLAFTYADATPRISSVRATTTAPSGDDGLLRSGPRISTHDVPSGKPVTYDAAGNETGYLVTRTYSARNHLREVIRHSDEPGDTLEHKLLYAYDGRGIRVARGETPSDGIAATATRYFFYSPELKLLSE
ncbi:MAG TPA: DUF6531 domain-containing protein, partial [Thermoanaerobaculia bacterium]|nr:DUF6531 domain-containing protein [Thermoanaerobaculia bacterium]